MSFGGNKPFNIEKKVKSTKAAVSELDFSQLDRSTLVALLQNAEGALKKQDQQESRTRQFKMTKAKKIAEIMMDIQTSAEDRDSSVKRVEQLGSDYDQLSTDVKTQEQNLVFLADKLEEISAKNIALLDKIRRNDEMWDKASQKKAEIMEDSISNKQKLFDMDAAMIQAEETIKIANKLSTLLSLEVEAIDGMGEAEFSEKYPIFDDTPNMSSIGKTSIEGDLSDDDDELEYANETFASCTGHKQSMLRDIQRSCCKVTAGEDLSEESDARSVSTDEGGEYFFPDSDDEEEEEGTNDSLEIMLVKTIKGRSATTTPQHRLLDQRNQRKSMSSSTSF